jgi:hypothetical protein
MKTEIFHQLLVRPRLAATPWIYQISDHFADVGKMVAIGSHINEAVRQTLIDREIHPRRLDD